jgi:hypothetical protein
MGAVTTLLTDDAAIKCAGAKTLAPQLGPRHLKINVLTCRLSRRVYAGFGKQVAKLL